MNEQDERTQAVVALLRQLSIGLSAYRLFPGDTRQPAFVEAVRRIGAAAEKALIGGTVIVGVHGEEFHFGEDPLRSDETLSRLAMACFERRAELLRVRAVPEEGELQAFYAALTTSVEDVAAAGGLQDMLTKAQVGSIALGAVELRAAPREYAVELTEEQAELWERLQEGGHGAAETLTSMTGVVPGEEAESIYSRLRGLVSALPQELSDDPDLYRSLRQAVSGLPPEVRSELSSRLIDQVGDEPVAERLLGTMTDTELAKVVVEVAEAEKRDPGELARQLGTAGSRREGLADLTAALVTGRKEAAEGAQSLNGAMALAGSQGGAVGEVVSDLMGKEMLASQQEDAQAILEEFPDSDVDHEQVAFATIRDFLAIEEDTDRLERVLELWTQEVRDSLGRRERERALRLVQVVEGLEPRGGDGIEERRGLFEAYWRRILDPSLIQALIGPSDEQEIAALRSLLAPFGERAIEALLDLLAQEEERTKRATLIAVLSELAADHHDLVGERLNDDRWYVVRNAVTVLHRSQGGPEIIPLLQRAARHPHPLVRREAIWGYAAAAGPAAIKHIRSMTVDADGTVRHMAVSALGSLVTEEAVGALTEVARNSRDNDLRRRALDELGRHPGVTAAEVLQQLASFRSRPRLPRRLRRHARTLLRRRRGDLR